MFENLFMVAVLIVTVIFVMILTIISMWRKVPQDKAVVVTGLKKRVISGGGGFVIPLFERTDTISLENMKIEVRTEGALTEQGVDIKADGVAVLKVKSDRESILSAVEQFNTGHESNTIAVIKDTAKDVLEGKLREIISKLTVEEIYKDREKFASQVQEVAALDLAQMGLEIKAFTIRDISDVNGYLQALGMKRIAEVKRDAEIAQAESAKEAKIRIADANKQGEQARIIAESQIAEYNKDKEIKVQIYRKDQEVEKARADLAYEIEANRVKKEVVETQMQVEMIKKEKETQLATQEALRREQELDATIRKQAEAEKFKDEKAAEAIKYREIQDAQARAESIRLEGLARAEAKRIEGMTEAEVIRETGKAKADAMLQQAEAFKQYNNAAVTQMIVERLPEIAASIAAPLNKTEKIVIVDNGGGGNKGASRVTGYITDIMAQLPETVEALTGTNLVELLKDKLETPKKSE